LQPRVQEDRGRLTGGLAPAAPDADAQHPMTDAPAIVVGGGPAGLAAAACLKRRGIDAVVLEAGPSLATSWRSHYARLRLHTVKRHSSLPGLPFPDEVPRYPTRAQVVDYLVQYAARFEIA